MPQASPQQGRVRRVEKEAIPAAQGNPLHVGRVWDPPNQGWLQPQTAGVSGSPSFYYSQNLIPATYTSASTVMPTTS